MRAHSEGLIFLAILPQWSFGQPPMGISYVGAYLRKHNHNVILRDFSIELYHALDDSRKELMSASEDTQYKWYDFKQYRQHIYPLIQKHIVQWKEEIITSKAEIVGFTILNSNKWATLDLISILKQDALQPTVIVGGPQLSMADGGIDILKHPGVDFAVIGEGEETSRELIAVIQKGTKDFSNIKGLLYREGTEIISTGSRQLIADLDEIPFPSYVDFKRHQYMEPAIPILSSRGCIYHCAFCSESVFWRRKFRCRSAANIATEIEAHLDNQDTRYFYIVDSLINGNIQELEQFCDHIIAHKLNIRWGGKAAFRKQMTRPLLDKLKRSGCLYLDFGLESGSPAVLKAMKKGFTVDTAERVIRESSLAGIGVGLFFLIGFPTESDEDYQLTREFLLNHEAHISHVIPGWSCCIAPGSDLSNTPRRYGIYWGKDGEWYSKYTSPLIRRKRLDDFKQLCSSLDVNVH